MGEVLTTEEVMKNLKEREERDEKKNKKLKENFNKLEREKNKLNQKHSRKIFLRVIRGILKKIQPSSTFRNNI